MLPSTEASAAAYGELRARITTTLEPLGADDLARQVPGCPAWSIADLVGHLVGNARDVSTLNLEGAASDRWTDAQVQRAKGRPLADLLADWAADGPAAEALLVHAEPGPAAQLVFDTATHEQDLYGALGVVAAREHDQQPVAFGFITSTLDNLIRGLGLPTLELRAGDLAWVLGEGEPAVRIEGSRFEVLRSLAGRRTRAELDALVTLGDLDPYLLIFGEGSPLQIPTTSLGE